MTFSNSMRLENFALLRLPSNKSKQSRVIDDITRRCGNDDAMQKLLNGANSVIVAPGDVAGEYPLPGDYVLVGWMYGNPYTPDGEVNRTNRVVYIDPDCGFAITKSGSKYLLGTQYKRNYSAYTPGMVIVG